MKASTLRAVVGEITELQRRPARQWQSAEESSLDAWFEGIAFYRSPERSISYYNKGEILGVLLDLRIRQLTDGTQVAARSVPVDEPALRKAAPLFPRLRRRGRGSGSRHRPELQLIFSATTLPE